MEYSRAHNTTETYVHTDTYNLTPIISQRTELRERFFEYKLAIFYLFRKNDKERINAREPIVYMNLIFSIFKFNVICFLSLNFFAVYGPMIRGDIAKYLDYWFIHERLFFRTNPRFLLSNDIWDYAIIVLRHHYGVVKMHSLPHEILQHAGVDEFSKGVELEKKEVELRGRWRKSKDCRWGYTREGWTLKLMIPREYPRRSTYHKSRVPRRRFFESHPEFSALFYFVHNSGVHFHR